MPPMNLKGRNLHANVKKEVHFPIISSKAGFGGMLEIGLED